MIQTITFSDFLDGFHNHDRDNQFSYNGKKALFDYLEQMENNSEPIEFDPIAICCDYTEYENADEAAKEYFDYEGMEFNNDGDEMNTAEEVEQKAIKYLEDKTTLLQFDGGIIIQDF